MAVGREGRLHAAALAGAVAQLLRNLSILLPCSQTHQASPGCAHLSSVLAPAFAQVSHAFVIRPCFPPLQRCVAMPTQESRDGHGITIHRCRRKQEAVPRQDAAFSGVGTAPRAWWWAERSSEEVLRWETGGVSSAGVLVAVDPGGEGSALPVQHMHTSCCMPLPSPSKQLPDCSHPWHHRRYSDRSMPVAGGQGCYVSCCRHVHQACSPRMVGGKACHRRRTCSLQLSQLSRHALVRVQQRHVAVVQLRSSSSLGRQSRHLLLQALQLACHLLWPADLHTLSSHCLAWSQKERSSQRREHSCAGPTA